MTLILVPYTYYVLASCLSTDFDSHLTSYTNDGEIRYKDLSKNVYSTRKSKVRLGFLFKLLIAAGLWYVFFLTYEKVAEIKPIKTFDPFEILEVSADVDKKKLKS